MKNKYKKGQAIEKADNFGHSDPLELSALMMAHLDEVEGGGAHSSWRRVTAQRAV